MKSRGLGDSIEKFTKATGIKSMVDRVSEGLNIPCGCEGRRDALNIFKNPIIEEPAWTLSPTATFISESTGRKTSNLDPKHIIPKRFPL